MADHLLAVTRIHGLAGRREELRAIMRETEAAVVSEPGCRLYVFTATLEDPDEYVNVQEWADEAAFAAHQSTAAFSDLPARAVRPARAAVGDAGSPLRGLRHAGAVWCAGSARG